MRKNRFIKFFCFLGIGTYSFLNASCVEKFLPDVQEAFELSNTTSPIEVEITEAFSWDEPTEIAYLELDIA